MALRPVGRAPRLRAASVPFELAKGLAISGNRGHQERLSTGRSGSIETATTAGWAFFFFIGH